MARIIRAGISGFLIPSIARHGSHRLDSNVTLARRGHAVLRNTLSSGYYMDNQSEDVIAP